MKPHILVAEGPLVSGQTHTALCGKDVENAQWVWEVQEPVATAKQLIDRNRVCHKCYDQPWIGRYLYVAAPGHESEELEPA